MRYFLDEFEVDFPQWRAALEDHDGFRRFFCDDGTQRYEVFEIIDDVREVDDVYLILTLEQDVLVIAVRLVSTALEFIRLADSLLGEIPPIISYDRFVTLTTKIAFNGIEFATRISVQFDISERPCFVFELLDEADKITVLSLGAEKSYEDEVWIEFTMFGTPPAFFFTGVTGDIEGARRKAKRHSLSLMQYGFTFWAAVCALLRTAYTKSLDLRVEIVDDWKGAPVRGDERTRWSSKYIYGYYDTTVNTRQLLNQKFNIPIDSAFHTYKGNDSVYDIVAYNATMIAKGRPDKTVGLSPRHLYGGGYSQKLTVA